MRYVYEVFLKGAPGPIRVTTDKLVYNANQAEHDMLMKDEGHSFAFINIDGSFARFRASEVAAILLRVES